jgi:hypothetical protein
MCDQDRAGDERNFHGLFENAANTQISNLVAHSLKPELGSEVLSKAAEALQKYIDIGAWREVKPPIQARAWDYVRPGPCRRWKEFSWVVRERCKYPSEVLSKAAEALQKYIDIGAWREVKLLIRFLGILHRAGDERNFHGLFENAANTQISNIP